MVPSKYLEKEYFYVLKLYRVIFAGAWGKEEILRRIQYAVIRALLPVATYLLVSVDLTRLPELLANTKNIDV